VGKNLVSGKTFSFLTQIIYYIAFFCFTLQNIFKISHQKLNFMSYENKN